MSLSIIMATRGRPLSLAKCLASFNKYAVNKIEVILGMDYDDPVPVNRDQYPKLNILTFLRERSDDMTNDYQNVLGRIASGRMIMAYTDDAVMTTPGFDCILEEKMKGRHMFLGDTSDNMRTDINNFTSFPVISRESMELLGWLMFPYYRSWSTDTMTYEIYRDAGLVVDCREVVSYHKWGVDDEAHRKMKRVFAEDMRNKGVEPVNTTKYVNVLKSFHNMMTCSESGESNV